MASPPPTASVLKEWLPLLLLQGLVAGIVLFPFIAGNMYFAFLDIASDTFVTSAFEMHLSRLFSQQGFTGWSFSVGLGAPLAFAYNDLLGQLSQLGGPDHVLQLRIWVYLLKIALGGGMFFLFVRQLVDRKEPAMLAALAYSFCGYIVVNGVWDSETGIYVFAPLVLWALHRHFRVGDIVAFPAAVALMLFGGVFFVMVATSIAVVFGVHLALSARPADTARTWLTRIFPMTALGFLLAAPYVLPVALQLLDSPRVGTESILSRAGGQLLSISDARLLLAQLGGLFHKDIFGIGSFHSSYMNYLESPGFYVGMLPLLVLPQLWKGGVADRRALVVGLLAVGAYFLFPVVRSAAFGFSAPYFRGTTLWVAIGLLVLGTRAIMVVLERGLDVELLAMGAVALYALLGIVYWLTPTAPNHVLKVAIAIGVWTATLWLAQVGRIARARLPSLLLLLLLVELVTMVWPSYFISRHIASPADRPDQDMTIAALAAIRADGPPAFYRVEKTFDSFSLADAVAQGYRGVKSYYYHGRSVVNFHENMDLMFQTEVRPVNYTNWLPGPGDRVVLYSVLGVRYLISHAALDWPGMEKIGAGPGYVVYRNDMALPLGVVQHRQMMAEDLRRLSSLPLQKARTLKDLAMLNAVVLDQPMPQWGRPFDLSVLTSRSELNAVADYAQPAVALQRTGLQVSSFAEDHITGTIRPELPGILVFSIPAYRGWSLKVDGHPVDLMVANFGMLAAPVPAGAHDVELTYRVPGLREGMLVGALGILVLGALRWRRARRRRGA